MPQPVGTELLDDPGADPALVTRVLGDIARANRWFGGVRALRAGLDALFPAGDRPSRCLLLDVGTGAGDLPHAAARWGRRRGIAFRLAGVERHRAAAALAGRNGVPCVVACGTALPFRPRAVDVVLLSQLLHHLDDHDAVRMLTSASQVARRGVIVTDLLPVAAAGRAFRVGGRLLGLHAVTIADGVTSLARGRSPQALLALARRAGAAAPHGWQGAFARVAVAWRTG